MPLQKKSKTEIEMIKEVQKLWELHWDNPTYQSWIDYQVKQDELLAYQKVSCWNNIKGIVYA